MPGPPRLRLTPVGRPAETHQWWWGGGVFVRCLAAAVGAHLVIGTDLSFVTLEKRF